MPVDWIIELISLTVLVGFLVFEQGRRARLSWDYVKGDPNTVGQGLDVGPLTPALPRLRSNYLSSARAQVGVHYKSQRVWDFRRAIIRLGFFRDRIEEPIHSPATQ
jgi:hypothetical protein